MKIIEKIRKKIKQIISNKWFYLFTVPLTLFTLGVAFSVYYIFTYDTHFTVMPIVQTENSQLQVPQSLLVDGNVVKGEFKATGANLGSVALNVKNLQRGIVDDNYKIFFRIKEKGSKDWFSSNSYNAGQFNELDLFPFGFNLLANSKDKTYAFEMFSKGADTKNALTVDPSQKIVGLYQLNKSDLKKPIFAMEYMVGKLVYFFQHIEGIFSLFTFFLPVFGYFYLIAEMDNVMTPAFLSSILFTEFIRQTVAARAVRMRNSLLSILKKIGLLEEYKPIKSIPILNIFLFCSILFEIFLLEKTNNILLLLIIVLWGIAIRSYKISLQSSFLLALTFLVFSFLFVLLQIDHYAEKLAIWAYLFLVIGVVHALSISISEKRKASKNTTKKN